MKLFELFDRPVTESNMDPIDAARELINNAPTGDDVVAELPDLIAQYAGHDLIAGIKEIMSSYSDASEITLQVDDLVANYEVERERLGEADYEGGIDFEPDAAYAGVKGVTTASGPGEEAAKKAAATKHGQTQEKVNATWKAMLLKAKKLEGPAREQIIPHLVKLAKEAGKHGIELNPNPAKILGKHL